MKPSSDADARSAKRVLIYRLGSLGDTIVSIPCLHLIARRFPNAERVMLTNFPVNGKAPASAAVIGDSGLVHRYMRYAVGTRNPIELARLWWQLLRFRPDVLVYLMPLRGEQAVRRDTIFFRLAGIWNFVGLPFGDLSKTPLDQRTGLYEHEASRLARCLAPLGDARLDESSSWDLQFTKAEHEAADAKLANLAGRLFFACSIGTKAQANDWTLPNWKAMLAQLTKEQPDCGLLLIGAPDEREACSQLAEVWNGPTLNLCGQVTPRESALVMSQAIAFVGHDSGPLHLAACVQVPCVGIYGARNLPGIWFPYGDKHKIIYHSVDCMGCGLIICEAQKKKCILSITADEVLTAVRTAVLRAQRA